jgi:hypothetical protein
LAHLSPLLPPSSPGPKTLRRPSCSAQLGGIFHLTPPELPPPLAGTAAPCAADCRPPPRASSQTKALLRHLHTPTEMVPSCHLFPLTPSKPMGIKTPLPPATTPPTHHLPDHLKRALAPSQLHHAHPRSPLFTSSPRAPHTQSTAAKLRSPSPLAHLAAPPPEVSTPLGSPRHPLASRASTVSHHALEWPLGRAPVNSSRPPL